MTSPGGKILHYRVFDVGNDVQLDFIQKGLLAEGAPHRYRLNKNTRAMIINNAPLALSLEGGQCEIGGVRFEYEASAKIWYFGAISICLSLTIPSDMNWNQLVELSTPIEMDSRLHEIAVQKTTQIVQQFDASRLGGINWETFEDYVIYFFRSLPGAEAQAQQALQLYDVPRLVLSESTENLADQVRKSILEGALQYSQNDLALINWNSAFVIEPSGSMDIPDVIEFALCQLLEMRYYDDLLDDRLAALYDVLERKSSIWENVSEKMSKDAAQKYLEISETVENVENSLKVVGDFYLAQIFRTASARFRFNDWRDSVDQKLNNLAQISKLLTSEVNERRNRLLELIVIALISIEVLPYIWRWIH